MRAQVRPKATVNLAVQQLRSPRYRPLVVKSGKAYTRKIKHQHSDQDRRPVCFRSTASGYTPVRHS